ncbi:DUF2442 domain-containing protein [uncultured Adlercreutzia sp.]|uniref:DUF2442 domain-containing protein n=1 Tax=uncultured Adlercreutzia sp. TaxID=875803 RepID=UPI0025D5C751|nr:DUF2442 domain-containing protein [uncultured Adlercreutzia sp.]
MEMIFDERLGDYVCKAGFIPWSVRAVEPNEDYTLTLMFADGSKRLFDFAPLLEHPCYSSLQSLEAFMRAQALHGTVDWGNDIDIAPEKLYEDSRILS